TITKDQIWLWEASHPNRSWPSRPDLYFWQALKMGGLPAHLLPSNPQFLQGSIRLTRDNVPRLDQHETYILARNEVLI
ncbi:hypothetical protein ACRCRN_17040, partial [Pseudomonas aeruginosa]